MTRMVVRVFIILFFTSVTSLFAQNKVTFDEVHHQLLDEYMQYIDSVEQKQPIDHYFEIYKRKHVSKVWLQDDRYYYRIVKKVKLYKNGTRYEKIDWAIRSHHKIWPFFRRMYEIKQVGHNYRFIEQIQYDFGKKIRKARIVSSFDDNYVLVKTLRPAEKKSIYFYLKPTSSLPLLHQD